MPPKSSVHSRSLHSCSLTSYSVRAPSNDTSVLNRTGTRKGGGGGVSHHQAIPPKIGKIPVLRWCKPRPTGLARYNDAGWSRHMTFIPYKSLIESVYAY